MNDLICLPFALLGLCNSASTSNSIASLSLSPLGHPHKRKSASLDSADDYHLPISHHHQFNADVTHQFSQQRRCTEFTTANDYQHRRLLVFQEIETYRMRVLEADGEQPQQQQTFGRRRNNNNNNKHISGTRGSEEERPTILTDKIATTEEMQKKMTGLHGEGESKIFYNKNGVHMIWFGLTCMPPKFAKFLHAS
jgi:hypothetical protein